MYEPLLSKTIDEISKGEGVLVPLDKKETKDNIKQYVVAAEVNDKNEAKDLIEIKIASDSQFASGAKGTIRIYKYDRDNQQWMFIIDVNSEDRKINPHDVTWVRKEIREIEHEQPRDEVIYSPWNDEEVKNLQNYQYHKKFAPFKCKCKSVLIPTNNGWVCGNCNSTFHWAYEWILDGSFWRIGGKDKEKKA